MQIALFLLAATLPTLALDAPQQTAARSPASGQRAIRAQVEEIGNAIVRGDFPKVVDSTYPVVIQMSGGRDKLLALMADGMKRLRESGKSFTAIHVGEPSEIMQGGSDLFTVVPTTFEMKVPEGRLTQKAFTLGISADQGKTWSFIDGNGVTPDQLRQIFPSFPPSLKLPVQEEPVIEKTPG